MARTRKQQRKRGAELDAFLQANSEELLEIARKHSVSDFDANEALANAAEKLYLSSVAPEHWLVWMSKRIESESKKVREQNAPRKPHRRKLSEQFEKSLEISDAVQQVADPASTEILALDRLEIDSLFRLASEFSPEQLQIMMLASQGHSVGAISADTGYRPAEIVKTLETGGFVRRLTPPQLAEAAQKIAENTVSGLAPEVDHAIDPALEIRIESIDDELIKLLANRPQVMRSLSSRKFEELLAELYLRHGFEVELTPKSKDGGCDLLVVKSTPFGRLLMVVEAKRYREDRPVGVGVVRAVFGTVNAKNASAGVVATTSFFTKGAREFQDQVPFRLALQDYNDLQSMIHGIKDFNEGSSPQIAAPIRE